MRIVLPFVLTLAVVSPAVAADFQAVSVRDRFLQVIKDRQLRLPLWKVTLNVKPDGQIEGDMMGWQVTGSWKWQDGYFCREMDWSGYPIEYNCQLVEIGGADQIRFTVDQGTGEAATFQLN